MKLYDGGRAPNPRRVTIFLAEKGIDLPKESVDIGKLEQRNDKFTKLNPLQRLPVLELDDGTILTETIAICRYLESIYPDPALFGTDPLDQALIEMWQRRIELNFFSSVAHSFRHLHPAAAELESPQVSEWGRVNQVRAIENMQFLDDHLANSQFIAGDTFTVADITAIVACQFLKPARIEMPEKLSNLRRWFDKMMERPSTAW